NDVPRLLEEVAGALRILEMQEAPDYLAAVRRFTENELLRRRRVPNGQQMDRLADALAGLEYFLEAVRDRRPRREQILQVARENLEALGYWPLPPEEALPASPAAVIPSASEAPAAAAAEPGPAPSAAPEAASEAEASAPIEAPAAEPMPDLGIPLDAEALQALPGSEPAPEPEPEAPVAPEPPVEAAEATAAEAAAPVVSGEAAAPAEPAAPVVAEAASGLPAIPGFDGSSDEIDDEIREVFLEEFQEEIGNLEQLLPAWRSKPEDMEQLRPIRR